MTEYQHVVTCNGDRSKPMWTKGTGCSCPRIEIIESKRPPVVPETEEYINPAHRQDCQLRYITTEQAKKDDWGCTCGADRG